MNLFYKLTILTFIGVSFTSCDPVVETDFLIVNETSCDLKIQTGYDECVLRLGIDTIINSNSSISIGSELAIYRSSFFGTCVENKDRRFEEFNIALNTLNITNCRGTEIAQNPFNAENWKFQFSDQSGICYGTYVLTAKDDHFQK